MYVKICGITKLNQALAIAQLGVDCLGYICVSSSPRFVTSEQVGAITEQLKDYKLTHTGVFLDADIDQISKYVYIDNLNSIQLHGNESPEFCQQVKLKFPQLRLIKAFRVKNPQILDQIYAYTDYVDVVLLDAYDPKFAGGTGKTINWSILQNFRPSCDWWLAGGLSAQNVEMAIAQLKPDGIDVSSGVEKSPGNKDLNQVQDLIRLAKPWIVD
jgi:phosphoribosylanthranilate isomerase